MQYLLIAYEREMWEGEDRWVVATLETDMEPEEIMREIAPSAQVWFARHNGYNYRLHTEKAVISGEEIRWERDVDDTSFTLTLEEAPRILNGVDELNKFLDPS